jgi:hypothetical protein
MKSSKPLPPLFARCIPFAVASVALAFLTLPSNALADTPFDGTWKLNTAKSDLAGETMSFKMAGAGTWKYTDSDQSYTFKADGTPIVTPMGMQRTFKKTGDGTFESTNTKGGVLLSTSTWTLSADGKTLEIESKGTKPNGDTFDNSTTFSHTSAGKGLEGSWKSTKVALSSPNSLTLATSGSDVTLTISAIKATCQAKWDGKDYPASGPTVSDGLTLALTKTSAKSFKLVVKAKEKVLNIAHYTVAADGQSMVEKGTDGKGKQPFTEVWEKQS